MIHLVFNSPYLGGAERSAVEQAFMGLDCEQLVFHIPVFKRINNDCPITKFILSRNDKAKISYFPFQTQLFQVSRSNYLSQIIGLFFVPIAIFKVFLYRKKMKLSKSDILWLNGNKAAVLFILSLLFYSSSAKWIWHWRDYPSQSGILSLIKTFLGHLKPFKLILLANSQSVQTALDHWKPNPNIVSDFIYNPSGAVSFRQRNAIKTLGIASMLAPWKGHHDVLLNLSLNKERLLKMGVDRCLIYGDEIYQTSGEHRGYKNQLEELIVKLQLSDFVFLKGSLPPQEIYKEIDLLIHSSLKAEPFGRVLIESFAAGIPILSTALGGAGEVIGANLERGWSYQAFHPNDFYQQILSIISDAQSDSKLVLAKTWSENVNHQIVLKMGELFKS